MADDLAELEAFNARAAEVERLVRGLQDGSVNPAEIDAINSENERKKQEKEERERLRKERAAKALAERLAKRKREEREGWWERAELLRGITREKAEAERKAGVGVRAAGDVETPEPITDDDGNILFPLPKKVVDRLDYSVWDSWIPDDPVSLEEMRAKQNAVEAENNRRFEEANPEFCKQFLEDQEKREESKRKKLRNAEKRKLEGNKHMKRRRYEEALKSYHDALKLDPVGVAILTNIAQAHLKLKQYDDVVEFCDRALFVKPDSTKALWRRARALFASEKYAPCISDLEEGIALDHQNEDFKAFFKKARDEFREAVAERVVCEKAKEAKPMKAVSTWQDAQDIINNPPTPLSFLMHVKDTLIASKSQDAPKEQTLALECIPTVVGSDVDALVFLRTSGILDILSNWTVECPQHIPLHLCLGSLACACRSQRNALAVAAHGAHPLMAASDAITDSRVNVARAALDLFKNIAHHEKCSLDIISSKRNVQAFTKSIVMLSQSNVDVHVRCSACSFLTELLARDESRKAFLKAMPISADQLLDSIACIMRDVRSGKCPLNMYEDPLRLAVGAFQLIAGCGYTSQTILHELARVSQKCESNDMLLMLSASAFLNSCSKDATATSEIVASSKAASCFAAALSPSRSIVVQSRAASLLAKCSSAEGVWGIRKQ